MSTADQSTTREEVSMGAGIIAVVGTFTGISALFVAARLYVRIKLMHNIGLDDYLIVLAMICGILNLGISSAAAEAGSGRHMDTLTLEQQQNVVKYTIAAFCPGILSFAIPKLAVVSLLTKLLAPSPAHTVFLWCSSGLTTAALIGCVIILYARCTPTYSQWDFSVKGECFSIWILVRYGIFAGSLSAAMDLYLAVYPAVILARLQMNIRKKMALASALGIGSVACIVAAYKCSRLPGLATDDFSYDTANLVIWTCIEGSTIIIASCIPILQPLVKVICDSSILSSARRGAGYSSNTPHQKSTHDTGVELSSELVKSGKAFSRARIGVSIPTEIDSQEQILAREESQERDHGYPRAVETNITRTDVVTVSYSHG